MKYQEHLASVLDWLQASERKGGGSSAYFAPFVGWARPYPETTGYLIPTLLAAEGFIGGGTNASFALRCGRWLVDIQNGNGSWNGGLHRATGQLKPSVFNTGQVLKGLVALWRWTQDEEWKNATLRGVQWLAKGMNQQGLWDGTDYRGSGTPSYYSEVLYALLDAAQILEDDSVIASCERGLEAVCRRVSSNGAIEAWGFGGSSTAFTHTIAYTIRGVQEGARLLERFDLEDAMSPALERLIRAAELRAGRLPGAFDQDWRPDTRYVCLTGNAQTALCVLLLEERVPDLRLVSAAARMVDVICGRQRLGKWPRGYRGGVPGSAPLSGPYMRFRYPNWAAKYTAEALMALIARINRYRT